MFESTPGVVDILNNLGQSLPALQKLVVVISALVGFVYVGEGIQSWTRSAKANQSVTGAAVASIFFGSFLWSIAAILAMGGYTFFREAASSAELLTSYNAPGSDPVAQMRYALVTWLGVLAWALIAAALIGGRNGVKYNEPRWGFKVIARIFLAVISFSFPAFVDDVGESAGYSQIGTAYFRFN